MARILIATTLMAGGVSRTVHEIWIVSRTGSSFISHQGRTLPTRPSASTPGSRRRCQCYVNDDGRIAAIDRESDTVDWTVSYDGTGSTSPLVHCDNVVVQIGWMALTADALRLNFGRIARQGNFERRRGVMTRSTGPVRHVAGSLSSFHFHPAFRWFMPVGE